MRKTVLILALGVIFFITIVTIIFFTRDFFSAKEPEIIHRPLPPHSLKTLQGDNVQITSKFPHQDYLLIFFTDSSPSSQQLLPLINETAFPQKLAVILIHIGRVSKNLSPKGGNIILCIDSDGGFAEKMGVRTVPTAFLIANGEYQINLYEGALTVEDLRLIPLKLEESRIKISVP